jgi:NADPH:quinone reductase-like Zn-dependent oxidoreductase
MMRQVWIPRVGGPEVLEVREAADPEPTAGQVRIRVAAAGVNFADLMTRIGLYPDAPKLPTVVGYEVAGTIDKVGAGVTGLAEGQRVLALTRFGGYSDVVVAPEALVAPLPDGLSFEKAAAIPVNYATAWLMLVYLGNVRAGERVLVHAAAGGVGVAAIQICKHRGAEIIGTASAGKHERLRALGVAHTIDYTTQDFQAEVARITGGAGVDIVLDAVGGKSFKQSYDSLAPLGRLFLFGGSAFSSGEKRNLLTIARAYFALPSFKPFTLMGQNRGVFGVNLGHLWDQSKKLQAMLREIMGLVEQRVLDPVVDKSFSFVEAGSAHAYMQARKNFGKVVLVPG